MTILNCSNEASYQEIELPLIVHHSLINVSIELCGESRLVAGVTPACFEVSAGRYGEVHYLI